MHLLLYTSTMIISAETQCLLSITSAPQNICTSTPHLGTSAPAPTLPLHLCLCTCTAALLLLCTLYTSTMIISAELNTYSAPQHLSTSALLHLCTSAPLHLQHLCTSARPFTCAPLLHLHLHLCTCTSSICTCICTSALLYLHLCTCTSHHL
jgi:hypothetical protein